MQMLGLQQEADQAGQMQAFRQQQLEQQGTQATQANAVGENRNFLDALELLNQQGTNPLVREAIRGRPGFEQIGTGIDQLNARDRATLLSRLTGELKAIQDPNTREMHGRTQGAAFPGVYEEALAAAYPPATGVTDSATVIPPEFAEEYAMDQEKLAAQAKLQAERQDAIKRAATTRQAKRKVGRDEGITNPWFGYY
jgi:hypothetical protein